MTLSNINGHFVDNETITDTSTGSAVVNRADASLIVDNVWKGATLGSLAALTNTKYPTLRGTDMPNHFAKELGDGSLYFCDFKNGQGLIHRINTKKVTNKGDTNGTTAVSAYNALDMPFGFYPTSIAEYGKNALITGIYTVDTTTNHGKSVFVIWDPTDTSGRLTRNIAVSLLLVPCQWRSSCTTVASGSTTGIITTRSAWTRSRASCGKTITRSRTPSCTGGTTRRTRASKLLLFKCTLTPQ